MARRTATVVTQALPSAGERLGAVLVVVDGDELGRYVDIGDDELVVGSDPACDLALTDESISSRHLSLRRSGAGFVVRDLGSKNGIIYEGSLIDTATVSPGATFQVGRCFLRIQPQLEAIDVEPSQSRRFGELVAESLIMREVFAVLELVVESEVTVLLEGETGTGKELVARALHESGARRKGPFVALDCGALPENLLESELFGHVRGAFTGAGASRAGAFTRASGGTLFLDELGGIPPAVQARLLRVIEERRVKPLGSDTDRSIDVRIIAASRHDLEEQVARSEFRADLFYRLSVIRVWLPPLAQRREDIAPIVGELLRLRGIEAGDVGGDRLALLEAYHWPGNVRELRNIIDRAIALSPGARSFADLRLSVPRAGAALSTASIRSDLPFAEAKQRVLADFELRYLRDVLARNEGNISATARDADIDRKHLKVLLDRHGLRES